MTFESGESLDTGRIVAILPYIAESHTRTAKFNGVIQPDGSTELFNKLHHTRLGLQFDDTQQAWVFFGWEDAALSANGSFPEALEEFSDGFQITINSDKTMYISAENREEASDPQPMTDPQIVAFKDILWGAGQAHLGSISIDEEEYSDESDNESDDAYIFAHESFSQLCAYAILTAHSERDQDEALGLPPLITRESLVPSGLPVDRFTAEGIHRDAHVQADVFYTPAELVDETPIEKHIAKLVITVSDFPGLTLIGEDNIPVITREPNIIFDQERRKVLVQPRDLPIPKIALDNESTIALSTVFSGLEPKRITAKYLSELFEA